MLLALVIWTKNPNCLQRYWDVSLLPILPLSPLFYPYLIEVNYFLSFLCVLFFLSFHADIIKVLSLHFYTKIIHCPEPCIFHTAYTLEIFLYQDSFLILLKIVLISPEHSILWVYEGLCNKSFTNRNLDYFHHLLPETILSLYMYTGRINSQRLDNLITR